MENIHTWTPSPGLKWLRSLVGETGMADHGRDAAAALVAAAVDAAVRAQAPRRTVAAVAAAAITAALATAAPVAWAPGASSGGAQAGSSSPGRRARRRRHKKKVGAQSLEVEEPEMVVYEAVMNNEGDEQFELVEQRNEVAESPVVRALSELESCQAEFAAHSRSGRHAEALRCTFGWRGFMVVTKKAKILK